MKRRLNFWQRWTLKRPARQLMASCYVDSGGTENGTLELFRQRAPQELGIDPATIALIIKILIALVRWWVETRSLNPFKVEKKEPVLNWNAEHEV